jgi:hypothetical protein
LWELGQNVNRSTSKSTLVWRGDVGQAGADAGDTAEGAFCFPLRLANAFKDPVLDVVSFPCDDPAIVCGFDMTIAG